MTRRLLNLILPPLMWICSSIDLLVSAARSPSDMSDANPSLLVPSGIAFSIWLPIFLFCISYGVIQALPAQKGNLVFRKIGWWTIAGFSGVCLWGLVNAFWPMASVQMATAIVFVPTMLLLVASMFKFQSALESPTDLPIRVSFIGISMIAGWCSLAVFLNWTPQIVTHLSGAGLSTSISSSLILATALLWIGLITVKSRGNGAYIIPPIWGLLFLILKRVNTEPQHMNIIITAGLGIAALLVIYFWQKRRLNTN